MKEEHLEFTRRIVAAGAFVRIKIGVWQASTNVSANSLSGIPSAWISDKVVYRHNFKIPEVRSTVRVVSACRRAIYNLSYSTIYGSFIAGPNIERFKSEMDEFRAKVFAARDLIVENHSNIVSRLDEQARELAVDIWRIKYGHDGTPHQRFIEKTASGYVDLIRSPEDLQDRFRFTIIPTMPLIEPGATYEKFCDREKHNLEVYERIFTRILDRRRSLVRVLIDTQSVLVGLQDNPAAMGSKMKSLLTKLQRYVWAIFYDDEDPELIDMIKELRKLLIVSDKMRSLESVVPHFERIIKHVVSHPFFRVGMEIVNG